MTTTDIVISKANSIRFAIVDGELPHFDNTLSIDMDCMDGNALPYCQTFKVGEAINIQILSGLTAAVVLTLWDEYGMTHTNIPVTEVTTYADFKIHDFVYTPASELSGYMTAESETTGYISEPFEVLADVSKYRKLNWFNLDTPSVNNNFEFDYTTASAQAYVNHCYVKAKFKDYKTGGESEVFDNQNELVKIKENKFRIFTFQTENIPVYLAELLILAQAHDVFEVEPVQFVCNSEPSISNSKANLVELSMDLTQSAILGINTHDIGFNCDGETTTKMINLEKLNATSDFTFAITAGYLLHSLTAEWNSGTGIELKIGITVGGSELADIFIGETAEDADLSEVETMVINTDYAAGASTIYCTLSGTSPNINVYGITLKNRLT